MIYYFLQITPPPIPPPPPPGLELDSSSIFLLGLIYGLIIITRKVNEIDL